MKPKQCKNVFHAIVNANLKKQHVIQNKYGMMKHIKKNIEMVVSEKVL